MTTRADLDFELLDNASSAVKQLSGRFREGIPIKRGSDWSGDSLPSLIRAVDMFLGLSSSEKAALHNKDQDPYRRKILAGLAETIGTVDEVLAKDEGASWTERICKLCRTQCEDLVNKFKRFKSDTAKLLAS